MRGGIGWICIGLAGLCLPSYVQAQPVLNAVVNAASYGSGDAISPGEMVVLFGTYLGPSSLTHLQLDSQGRIATSLGGVQVTFDGAVAPLIYVSPNQIAAMVPLEMAQHHLAQVQVNNTGALSNVLAVQIVQTVPGVFSADATGQGIAAANNADGSPNSVSNPARPGSYLTFYLTGEGPENPPGVDGFIATGKSSIAGPITVTIGGVNAQVLYAGSAPGEVKGLAQVNVVVPDSLPSSGELPLLIQIDNAASQPGLTIAVAGAPLITDAVTLSWRASTSAAVLGYNVYRSMASGGQYSRLNSQLITATSFNDEWALAGNTYYYVSTAVDANNNESGYSNQAHAVIPYP